MSEYVVKLPDVGEGIAEAEIVEWHVNAGDTIVEDQVMVEVMTDKATVELPSPVAGVVLSVGAAVGEILSVGSPLIRIETGESGSSNGDAAATPAETPPPAPPPTPCQRRRLRHPHALAPPAPETVAVPANGRASPITAAPAVRQRASALGIDLSTVTGSRTRWTDRARRSRCVI